MATPQKFDRFVTDLALGVHNLNLDAVKVYLSNDPPAATDTVKTDVTEIGIANGYTGAVDIMATVTQNAGVMEMSASDVVITASGGNVGPFRYVIMYNDTPSSPLDPLIVWIDYGSSLTLVAGEMFTIDFPAVVLQLS